MTRSNNAMVQFLGARILYIARPLEIFCKPPSFLLILDVLNGNINKK